MKSQDLESREFVRRYFPEAVAYRNENRIVILRYPRVNGTMPPIMGAGGTEGIAWENARRTVQRRLPEIE